MPEEYRFRINPRVETPPQTRSGAGYAYRYAYARSAASRAAGGTGRDYLTFRDGPGWFAFALCDGVAQSFFADVAARICGDGILRWLEGVPSAVDVLRLSSLLADFLQQLAEGATRWVEQVPIREDLAPQVRQAVAKKRASGGEATFACGRLDLPGNAFPRGRLLLAWMGDARLRLWGPAGERTGELGASPQTGGRWSTARGPVDGGPSVYAAPLAGGDGRPEVVRLLAYSDGLHRLDEQHQALSDIELQDLIAAAGQAPGSDDMSVLEIWLASVPESIQRQPLSPVHGFEARLEESCLQVRWRSLPGAHSYQVEVWGSDGTRGAETSRTGWTSEPLSPGMYQVRVRGLDSAGNPGYWNKPETVQVGQTGAAAVVPGGDVTSVRPAGEADSGATLVGSAARPDLEATLVRSAGRADSEPTLVRPAATRGKELPVTRPSSGRRPRRRKRRFRFWFLLVVLALCAACLLAAVLSGVIPLPGRHGTTRGTATWTAVPGSAGDAVIVSVTVGALPVILPTQTAPPTPTRSIMPAIVVTSTPSPIRMPTEPFSAFATPAADVPVLSSPLPTPTPKAGG